MIELEEIQKHIVLYSKRHYQRSASIFDDLRQMVAVYTNSEPQYIKDQDSLNFVIETFFAVYGEPKKNGRTFYNIFRSSPEQYGPSSRYTKFSLEFIVSSLLSELSISEVMDVKNDIVLINLGEADSKYLPLSPKNPKTLGELSRPKLNQTRIST